VNKHLLQVLLITFVIGSCAQAPASPLPSPVTTTQIINPSETPRPTETSIPSATSYPPLQTDGPYLIAEWRSVLTLMDADGNGRKEIQLPNYGFTTELERSISPDGNLIAYFTGSTEEPYDLALNLFNLSDETSQIIANLIAPGFPQNLEPVAETLNLSDYDPFGCNYVECLAILSSYDFILGITSLAWSPNGQFLAFAAQTDGPSSDIYLYDRKNQGIRRLTEEIQNIWQMEWSPSGEKILYQATVPGPINSYIYSYVADPKINLPQSSQASVQYYLGAQLGWVANNSFLYALSPNGLLPDSPMYESVLSTNLENNETKEIWPYGAESIALDLTSSKVILSTKGADNSGVTAGTYLVSLDGSFTKISDTTYKFFEDAEPFKTFLGLDTDGQIYNISLDGDIRLLGPSIEYTTPSISPNKKWVLVFENNNTKITLYSDNLQLVNSWRFDKGIYSNGIQWRPDSMGIIISIPEQRYYLSIPDGTPAPIEIPGYSFTWLP
jgi:hypothetical protein